MLKSKIDILSAKPIFQKGALTRLGLADVKSFGLEWKDCEKIMKELGFKLEVNALEIA